MKKEIPQFSARQINKAGDYKRFHHAMTYIKQRSDMYKDDGSNPDKIRQLMAAVGYVDQEKFRSRRKEWDVLERKIPHSYFDAIGVDFNVLDCAIESDQEEYRSALEIEHIVKSCIVCVMPFMYQDVMFPEELLESEAIEMLQKYAKDKNRQCCIKIQGLKTIYIDSDGTSRCEFCVPQIKVTKKYIYAVPDNSKVGQVFIK